jgi:hypothetical protein
MSVVKHKTEDAEDARVGGLVPDGPVLLCYDGSDVSAAAIRRAGALLRRRRALVVDVSHNPFASGVGESGCELARAAGFDAVDAIRAGHGPSAVLDRADERDASVIVAARGRPPGPPGGLAAALIERSDVPVLVADAGGSAVEPIFVCYDGSGSTVVTAGELLSGRTAIVAAFMAAVDDGALLRSALPWPAGDEAQDLLARIAREEAVAPAKRAAEGARLATAAGFAARPLGITGADAPDDEEDPSRLLLRTAAHEAAACVVIGRSGSMAHDVVRHADRPVLVAR